MWYLRNVLNLMNKIPKIWKKVPFKEFLYMI
jgi:hypothetical protein